MLKCSGTVCFRVTACPHGKPHKRRLDCLVTSRNVCKCVPYRKSKKKKVKSV